MKNLFSIGEIAAIFGETKETFRHYDRIGLLEPYIIKSNGYRYYSLDQFEIINTILYLRSIGTSISKIKEILLSRSRKNVIDELKLQMTELKKQIEVLKLLEYQASTLLKRLEEFNDAEIRLSEEPVFYILYQAFSDVTLAIDPSLVASFHEGIDSEWLKHSNIISIIQKGTLLKGEFHKYSRYGILSEMQCPTPNVYYHTLPARRYVIAYKRIETYEHSEIDDVYENMLDFIKSNNLSVAGDAFERNILDLYNKNAKGDIHYIKIYIPVL